MKRKVIILLLALACSITMWGCGPEKMTELTDSERQQIVQFSAHIVGEFNRAQTEGYTGLSKKQLDSIREQLNPKVEEETQQSESSSDSSTQNNDSSNTQNGNDIQLQETDINSVVGVNGIEAEITKYDLQSDYVEGNAFAMTAERGNTYLILHINLANTTNNDVMCDIFNKDYKYEISINNGETVSKSLSTLLTKDFSTFADTIKAKGRIKTVLMFEVSESAVSSISNLALNVKTGDTTQTIRIK